MSSLSPEEFVKNNAFDYIVVGGGTAGLVVATRLSEDASVTVGVIEAGGYHPEEPLINVPGYFGRSLGNPTFDWAFLTVPQKHANDRAIFNPRGKLLGGSSALNFMTLGRASKEEYDALESLGSKGWNWVSFLKYIKKSQTLIPSDNEFIEKFNTKLVDGIHGTSGPIKKSHSPWQGDLSIPFFQTLQTFGLERNPDAATGLATGSYTILSAVDPDTARRSYSASAYYAPNASRPNLVVLTGAQATKIILEGDAEPYTATAIEFVSGGKKYSVPVKKEVILAAGAFQTPQLLELSGIGDPSILNQVGIPSKVQLPGVGSNLQDHIYVPTVYKVKPEVATLDLLNEPGRSEAEEVLYNSQKGLYGSTHFALAFLPTNTFTPPEDVTRLKAELKNSTGFDSTPGLKKQHRFLEQWFDDKRHAQLEVISYPGFFPSPDKTPEPNAHYHMVAVANTHPISRGTVHIQSADALVKPTVDPAYLSSTIDLDILVHGVKFTRALHGRSPLKEMTVGSVDPAWIGDESDDVSDNNGEKGMKWDDDEAIREYVRNELQTVCHPVGTAAMLPREDGGVVDSKLKVYGTANLRVVDASIFPLQIAAHPQETIYGIAEKFSDIIKEDATQPGNKED
ncbi:GMC oxidoreductase [Hydnum rufescens UP504]|uniref:GMC oxidoreductase n=1 Tax=Hydnum rufescens UP504 TaxID=1448309 RepID=A0A9P6ARG4_9AGAM|nr:GMC oxidoreductase [Hydnum rufescens UP504]